MVDLGQDRAVSPLCHHAVGHVGLCHRRRGPNRVGGQVGADRLGESALAGPSHVRLTASYTGRIRSRPRSASAGQLRHNPAASRAARILVAAMRHSRASRSTSSQFRAPRLAEPARGQQHENAGTPAPTDPRLAQRQDGGQLTGSMARYAYPVLVDRGVDQIGREDALRVLTPIWSSKHALGVKVRGRVRAVLSWCQAHGLRGLHRGQRGHRRSGARWRLSRRTTGRSTTERSRMLSRTIEASTAPGSPRTFVAACSG